MRTSESKRRTCRARVFVKRLVKPDRVDSEGLPMNGEPALWADAALCRTLCPEVRGKVVPAARAVDTQGRKRIITCPGGRIGPGRHRIRSKKSPTSTHACVEGTTTSSAIAARLATSVMAMPTAGAWRRRMYRPAATDQ